MESLHIYNQDAWHDNSIIIGTEESLNLLKQAIENALEWGHGKSDLFCNDGEGFCLRVIKLSEVEMDRAPVPYNADYARASPKETQEFMRKLYDFYENSKVRSQNWHMGV